MKSLTLNWCPLLSFNGFAHLHSLTKLEVCNLFLLTLCLFPNGVPLWKRLNLCGCHISIDSVVHLGAHLTALRHLNLKQTYLRDAGSHLGFPNLERLCLSRCLISDVTIGKLAANTRLRSLHLDCCRSVSASGLLALTQLTGLESLGISWGRSAPNIFAPTDPSRDTLTDDALELVSSFSMTKQTFCFLRKRFGSDRESVSRASKAEHLTSIATDDVCPSASLPIANTSRGENVRLHWTCGKRTYN